MAGSPDDLAARVGRLENRLLLAETYAKEAFWHALDQVYRHSLPGRDLSCIICGHVDRRTGFEVYTDRCRFGGGELERYKCPDCGCIFGAQKYLDLPERIVELDYELLYSGYSEGDSSANEIRTFIRSNLGRMVCIWTGAAEVRGARL